MSMTPSERDEALYLQVQRFKSLLESEGILRNMRELNEIMNGTPEKAGLPVRVASLEDKIGRLVKSNAKLQKALYICTGAYIALKIYLEIKPPHP